MKKRISTPTNALLALIYCILFLLGALLPPRALSSVQNASAAETPVSGSYACVLSEAFFYSAPDERRGLFLLPKTYFVRLVEYGESYCKIEYLTDDTDTKKLTGYAKTETLSFVDFTPTRPYLYYFFDVRYRIDGSEEDEDNFLTEITLTCTYYGDYTIGSETYCYVLRGDEFGYIPKPASLSYEENPEYADYIASLSASPPTDDPEQTASRSSSPAQIAILIALCLLVPVLAALILKPPRRPPYEQEE